MKEWKEEFERFVTCMARWHTHTHIQRARMIANCFSLVNWVSEIIGKTRCTPDWHSFQSADVDMSRKLATSVEFQSILCSTTIPFCTTLSLSSSFNNNERRLIRSGCNESNWNQFSDAARYLIAVLQYLFGTSFGSETWLFDYLGVVYQFAVFVVVVAATAAAAALVVCSTLNHVSLLFSITVVRFRSRIVAVLFFRLVYRCFMNHFSLAEFLYNVQSISMIIILCLWNLRSNVGTKTIIASIGV